MDGVKSVVIPSGQRLMSAWCQVRTRCLKSWGCVCGFEGWHRKIWRNLTASETFRARNCSWGEFRSEFLYVVLACLEKSNGIFLEGSEDWRNENLLYEQTIRDEPRQKNITFCLTERYHTIVPSLVSLLHFEKPYALLYRTRELRRRYAEIVI